MMVCGAGAAVSVAVAVASASGAAASAATFSSLLFHVSLGLVFHTVCQLLPVARFQRVILHALSLQGCIGSQDSSPLASLCL